jgi:peptide/nickel transport system permease protein
MAQLSLSRQSSVDKIPTAGRSLTRDAWRRLRRSKSAIIGGILLLAIVLGALLAPLISPYDPIKTSQRTSLEAPSLKHPMGTDRFGRDVLSRVLWGGRLSLPVGFVSVLIAAVFGVALGLIAGFHGGALDGGIMRFVDLLLAFPGILLALAIVAILGASLLNLMIAVGIASIPGFTRIVRGSVLSIKEWPHGDRPRERLLRLGAGALSTVELLTILIENLVGRYLAGRAMDAISNAERSRAEAAAKEEVRNAVTQYCAAQPNAGAGLQICGTTVR